MTFGLCCQSGEAVTTNGLYEVVGVHLELAADEDRNAIHAREPNIRVLQIGQAFPDYDGRAVSWYLLKPAIEADDAQGALTGSKS